MSTIKNDLSVYEDLGLTRRTETKPEETKQDQFMKLLIAQLENQDPFEPQENGEFLSQLAQFDTATGVKELQNSFSTFASTMQSNSALQASSLVGHSVLVPGNKTILESGGTVSGVIDLTSSTQKLTLEITDSVGQLVRTISLGQAFSGDVPFTWDGKNDSGNSLPPGLYKVSARAEIGNESMAQSTMLNARVESVTVGQMGQGIKLNLAGLGSVNFNEVKEIR